MWIDLSALELDHYLDTIFAHRSTAGESPRSIGPLAEFSAILRRHLVPVEPSPAFREALHCRLLAEAKASNAERPVDWPASHRRELILGAALGSVVSVAGLAAWMTRGRLEAKRSERN